MLSLLCRFVDWDLRRSPVTNAGALTILVGALPWFGLLLTGGRDGPPAMSAGMVGAIVFTVTWFSFCGWRGWLLLRETGERGDRLYDRKGKYLLPPEYAETESATKARKRRRNLR